MIRALFVRSLVGYLIFLVSRNRGELHRGTHPNLPRVARYPNPKNAPNGVHWVSGAT
jgi:hypothetical protein